MNRRQFTFGGICAAIAGFCGKPKPKAPQSLFIFDECSEAPEWEFSGKPNVCIGAPRPTAVDIEQAMYDRVHARFRNYRGAGEVT